MRVYPYEQVLQVNPKYPITVHSEHPLGQDTHEKSLEVVFGATAYPEGHGTYPVHPKYEEQVHH
jgi:hypothetical protein